MAFGCPRCGAVSHSPQDEANGYCGRCRDFTGQEPIRYGHLPLLDVFELRELLGLLEPANPLYTAVAETILNARNERHARAIQMIYSLSRMLATMKLTTIPGTPELNGLSIFERALKAIEGFVRDHSVVEAHRHRPDDNQVIDVPPDPPPWLMDLLRAPSPLALVELLTPDETPPQ